MNKTLCLLGLLLLFLAACDSIDPVWTPAVVLLETSEAAPTITPYVPPPTEPPTPAPTPLPPVFPTATETLPPAGEPTATPTVVLPPIGPPPANVADWPEEVARLVNDLRARNGLSPLTYRPVLAQAAQQHANDCSQRGSCSNLGADGSDVGTRLARLGYTAARSDQVWAMNGTPGDAVSWWEGEDWARRLLLSTTYSEIGVGVAPAPWGYYFIAVFAQP